MTIETGDLRKQPRTRVLMHATVIGADGQRRVRVSDVTPSGARIAPGHGLNNGSDVLFKRGLFAVAARVAWITRAGAGLEFYRQIDGVALATTDAGPTNSSPNRSSYLIPLRLLRPPRRLSRQPNED